MKRQLRVACFVVVLLMPFISCAYSAGVAVKCTQTQPLKEFSYRLVKSYPHNPSSFTQGLVVEGRIVYESIGLKGVSSLLAYDYASGKLLNRYKLPKYLFAEGLALVGERLVQLTYKAGKGLIYDKHTFEKLSEFVYPTEGWGLTYDGTHLIMSNGTSTLFYLDPKQFNLVKKIDVKSEGVDLKRLNELEYIDGKIFANVWQENKIAIISPETGCNTAWLNLHGLLEKVDRTNRVDVLNGIAYLKDSGHLLVTGKWWPKLFEIEIVE